MQHWSMENGEDFDLGMLARACAELRPGQFGILQYERAFVNPLPYAQTARDRDGFYCEVISSRYLPPSVWSLDRFALIGGGWLRPDLETDNWWQRTELAEAAAEALMQGLRQGRKCTDESAFGWRVGTFPPGGGGGDQKSTEGTRGLAA